MRTSDVLPRRFLFAVAATFGLWLALGVGLNPFFSDQYQITNAILAGEAVLALILTTVAFWRAKIVSGESQNEKASTLVESNRGPPDAIASPTRWIGFTLVFLGTIVLHRFEWMHPRFIDDDRINLEIARSWTSTCEHLLRPFNEHLLVPTRIWAFAAVQSTSPNSLPYVLLAGIWTLFGIAALQLFRLARREFGGDGAGILALAGFSLTYVHHECFWWFMAAQWLWTLNILLAVWLILDPERPTNARANIAALAAFVGPFTFSIGLVVGPCASAWIATRWKRNCQAWWRPLIGTAIGLLLTTPLIAAGLREEDPGRYNVQIKWFALDLWQGLGSTARLVVDYLVFTNFGIPRDVSWNAVPSLFTSLGFPAASWPPVLPAMIFPFVAAVPALVLTRHPACWRLAPFVFLIVLTYGIVVPFRSWMDYPQMSNWTARYHLLPQLGMILFLVGAWAEWRKGSAIRSSAVPLLAASLIFVYQESTHFAWKWPS